MSLDTSYLWPKNNCSKSITNLSGSNFHKSPDRKKKYQKIQSQALCLFSSATATKLSGLYSNDLWHMQPKFGSPSYKIVDFTAMGPKRAR